MATKLHICIDCGGTKTAAVISTYQNGPVVLSRAYGGPSNYKDNGLRTFLSAIRTAAQGALDTLNHGAPVLLPTIESILTVTGSNEQPPTTLYSAWIGASGVDATQDVVTLSPLLSRLLGIPLVPHRLMVQNDSHLLSSSLLTASGSIREAVVAIAGTGSVAVSFRKQRLSHQDVSESIVRLARGSGTLNRNSFPYSSFTLASIWPPTKLGDGDICLVMMDPDITPEGRQVLRGFNKGEVHGTPSETGTESLTSMILSHFNLKSPEDLFSVIYAPDSVPDVFVDGDGNVDPPDWTKLDRKQRIVSLCPLVFHAAFQLKDDMALRALRTSIGGLAGQIASLCTGERGRTEGKHVSSASAILCLGGSLFKAKEYQNLLVEALGARGQRFERVVFVEDACKEGALGLAKLSP